MLQLRKLGWGPWTTVTYLDSFGDSTWKFMYEFNQKWMSADDLSLWMVSSGVEIYDSFNVIKATLTLKTDGEALHIDSPTAGTVLTPGQTVTATGTGTNLSWDVDRIHDGLASFATGSGSSITFMIPADSTSDQVIVIRLSGDGGSDERTYAISGVPPGTAHAINAGGGTAGLFGADTGYSGGYTYATSAWIDTSQVSSPAPQEVYQTERWFGDFSYTMSGLSAGSSYTVRLHFAEIYWSDSGQRLFNVAINDSEVLNSFDIFHEAGGANRGIVREFGATADGNEQIRVSFSTILDAVKVSGIEILDAP